MAGVISREFDLWRAAFIREFKHHRLRDGDVFFGRCALCGVVDDGGVVNTST